MTSSKLDKLTVKRQQLNAQIQALKAQESKQKRKEETKKKVLVGSVVLKMLETGEMPQERLAQILDKHLTRDADRALFELPQRNTQAVKEDTMELETAGA